LWPGSARAGKDVEVPMAEREFAEAYEADEKRLRGAILTEPIAALDIKPPVTVQPGAPVREAVRLMTENHTGCVCVVEREALLGIFTERDLLSAVQNGVDLASTRVGELMTEKPETLRRQDGIAQALNRMTEGGYRHVPIVDAAGRPVGIIAMRDIVRFIVSLFPDAVFSVPPDPQAIPTLYGG
jgi:CBS domain-containing protein